MTQQSKGTIPNRLATAKDLPKWNAERDARSKLSSDAPIIVDKGMVSFSPGETRSGQPESCYNCVYMNRDNTCALMSPEIRVEKFIWPPEKKPGEIQIEYWPWCGKYVFGPPNSGEAYHCADLAPDDIGLTWINAPDPDQKFGGANCGGVNGGDNCDNYQDGFCRVLQQNVKPDDACAAWQDDDEVTWQRAQELLKGLGEDHTKKSMVRSILSKD